MKHPYQISPALQDAHRNWKYHLVCARATLYPGKTLEEVNTIVDKLIEKNIEECIDL